jgi:hypothetical protein
LIYNSTFNITINIDTLKISVGRDWIWNGVSPPIYSVTITQTGESRMPEKAPAGHAPMPLSKPKPGGNGITAGGQGSFTAQLLNNGVPISLPGGSSWSWSDDDPSSTITLDPSDPTGGSVIVTVPASDTAAQLTLSASTVDPTGATQTGSLVVPIAPGVSIFTVTVTQTA